MAMEEAFLALDTAGWNKGLTINQPYSKWKGSQKNMAPLITVGNQPCVRGS